MALSEPKHVHSAIGIAERKIDLAVQSLKEAKAATKVQSYSTSGTHIYSQSPRFGSDEYHSARIFKFLYYSSDAYTIVAEPQPTSCIEPPNPRVSGSVCMNNDLRVTGASPRASGASYFILSLPSEITYCSALSSFKFF